MNQENEQAPTLAAELPPALSSETYEQSLKAELFRLDAFLSTLTDEELEAFVAKGIEDQLEGVESREALLVAQAAVAVWSNLGAVDEPEEIQPGPVDFDHQDELSPDELKRIMDGEELVQYAHDAGRKDGMKLGLVLGFTAGLLVTALGLMLITDKPIWD